MNLLLISEIAHDVPLPEFGPEFQQHMEAKHHPSVRNASRTAWYLLAMALKKSGIDELPKVRFEEAGKPVFADFPLYFSLSHSENLAAALLSSTPCAVDIQAVRIGMPDKLMDRCMNERERILGCDFFECWGKKECLGKLSGRGLSAHPSRIDSLDAQYADHFHLQRLTDAGGQEFQLCALCMNREELHIQEHRNLPFRKLPAREITS